MEDFPGSRKAIDYMTSKTNVYFLMVIALLSGLVGVVGVLTTSPQSLKQVPDILIVGGIGLVGFSVFYPWFCIAFFARHFLASLRRLEHDVELLQKARPGPSDSHARSL